MAIVKCRECGAAISSKAATCPQCGRPQKSQTSIVTWIVGGFFTFIVGSCVIGMASRADHSAPPSTSASLASAEAAAPAVASSPTAAPTIRTWAYHNIDDPLRKRTGKSAEIDSQEEFHFDFPYNRSPNLATLGIQDKPGEGKGIWLSIQHGQFSCAIDCTVAVRFDDGPVRRMSARSAAAGRSDVIFIVPYQLTIASIKKSKWMHVEATFYKEGDQQMTFDLRGLDWAP